MDLDRFTICVENGGAAWPPYDGAWLAFIQSMIPDGARKAPVDVGLGRLVRGLLPTEGGGTHPR